VGKCRAPHSFSPTIFPQEGDNLANGFVCAKIEQPRVFRVLPNFASKLVPSQLTCGNDMETHKITSINENRSTLLSIFLEKKFND
jgi:hypothetical protein